MNGPRVIWWFDTLPTQTIDLLSDKALASMLKVLGSANRRFISDADKLPAAEQGWLGSHVALCVYGSLGCQDMRLNRGHDTGRFWEFANTGRELVHRGATFLLPPWYEDEDVITSHRSVAQRNDALDDTIDAEEFWPILWPVIIEDGGYELRVNKEDKAALYVDDLWLPDDVRRRVVNL